VTKREWHGGTGQTLVMVLQFGLRLGLVDLQWRIQDLPGGGPRRARGGSGDGAPSVVQGLPEPLRGAGKLKALCSFSYKKWPNVTDLNEKLPPCLRQTASPSHAQPALSFSQWGRGGVGGGRPPGLPIAGFAIAILDTSVQVPKCPDTSAPWHLDM